MRRLSKKKGFTLIEIVVSLAIFTIISVGFYSLFSAVFINTYRTAEVTEATFLAQRELEDEILSIKNKIINSETISEYTLNEYTLFSGSQQRTVNGYHMKFDATSNVTLETLVSETRPPELRVPTLYPFSIAASYLDGGITRTAKYPTIDIESLSLDVVGSLSTSNDGLLIRYLYYWYISDTVGYTPYDEPVFPDNYALIPGETTRMLTNIPQEYAGRYIKLVVTPVGEKGRMGQSVESNTIYISQFDKSENLLLRMDSSYINVNDTDQISKSGLNNLVSRWLSVVPVDMRRSQSSSSPPLLERLTIVGENSSNLVNVVTSIDSNNKSIISGSATSINSKRNITAYLSLYLSEDLINGTTILQAGSTSGSSRWELVYNNNQLILRRQYTSSSSSIRETAINVEDFKTNSWNFIRMNVWDNQLYIDINGTTFNVNNFNTTATFNSVPMYITVNNNIKIGDLLIYDGKHTSQDGVDVLNYLNNKYYPE